MQYSETVLDHFEKPRNISPIAEVTHTCSVSAPFHGDFLQLKLRIEDDTVRECQIRVFGCTAAIATASAFSEMIVGSKLDDAKKITREDIAAYVGGLSETKIQCSTLGPDALRLIRPV